MREISSSPIKPQLSSINHRRSSTIGRRSQTSLAGAIVFDRMRQLFDSFCNYIFVILFKRIETEHIKNINILKNYLILEDISINSNHAEVEQKAQSTKQSNKRHRA